VHRQGRITSAAGRTGQRLLSRSGHAHQRAMRIAAAPHVPATQLAGLKPVGRVSAGQARQGGGDDEHDQFPPKPRRRLNAIANSAKTSTCMTRNG